MISHRLLCLAFIGSAMGLPSFTELPTDCRNQTAKGMPGQDDGKLVVMSWHIHYNTITGDQERFYEGFMSKFGQYFNPEQYAGYEKNQCPFGPNFGSNTWKYICSLEGPYQEHSVGLGDTKLGGMPWSGPQRAFFIPSEWIDEAWAWAQANKGELDVLKHPNTGCMHDDHSVRALWNSTLRDKCDIDEYAGYCQDKTCAELTKTYSCAEYYAPGKTYEGWCDKTCGYEATDPTISVLNFPCNVPGTGCNDTEWPNQNPACGCDSQLPLPDDAPEDACKGCTNQYTPAFMR